MAAPSRPQRSALEEKRPTLAAEGPFMGGPQVIPARACATKEALLLATRPPPPVPPQVLLSVRASPCFQPPGPAGAALRSWRGKRRPLPAALGKTGAFAIGWAASGVGVARESAWLPVGPAEPRLPVTKERASGCCCCTASDARRQSRARLAGGGGFPPLGAAPGRSEPNSSSPCPARLLLRCSRNLFIIIKKKTHPSRLSSVCQCRFVAPLPALASGKARGP